MARASGSMTPMDGTGIAALETRLRRRFRTVETPVAIGDTTIQLLHPESAEDLISADDFDHDERLPYWADVWPSAHVLAAQVLAMEGLGRSLLELGCGAGLVSACAVRAGFNVTATDYYADALQFTAVNTWREGVAVRTRMVDWRDMPADLGRFDVVLASDVLYERPYAALVAGAIAATLAPGGFSLVADPGRVAAPAFDEEAAALGLGVERLARVPFEVGTIRQNIDIRRLRRESFSP